MKNTTLLPILFLLFSLIICGAFGGGFEDIPPEWEDTIPKTEFSRDSQGKIAKPSEEPSSSGAFKRVWPGATQVPTEVKEMVKVLDFHRGREGIDYYHKVIDPDSLSRNLNFVEHNQRKHMEKKRKDKEHQD